MAVVGKNPADHDESTILERGLGNRRTIQELKSYIRAQDPTALFLAETWAGEARLINLCTKLGFDQHWVSPQANRLGCLALFWKNIVKIDVVSSSSIHIDAVVGNRLMGSSASLVCMVLLIRPKRVKLGLCFVSSVQGSRCCGWLPEDFNEILWSHEKCGMGPRSENQMKAFRDMLDKAGLKDLGFVGKKFT